MKQNNNKNFPHVKNIWNRRLGAFNNRCFIENCVAIYLLIFERKGGKWEAAWSGEF